MGQEGNSLFMSEVLLWVLIALLVVSEKVWDKKKGKIMKKSLKTLVLELVWV